MDRRKLLAGFLGSGAAAILTTFLADTQFGRAHSQPSSGPNANFAYVGSFTTAERKARGDGIQEADEIERPLKCCSIEA
jgi:hypothetical protein